MIKIEFNDQEIERLYQQFMEHPPGLVKKKLHVIYLKSLGLPHHQIALIARVSGDTVTDYLKEYGEGGLAAINVVRIHCPTSSLLPYQDQIKSHFQNQPPHTVAEASHEIGKLTGIRLSLSACRDFLRKHLGMRCRKMGVIPSKADPEK